MMFKIPMKISDYLQIWNKLSAAEQHLLEDSAVLHTVKAGENVHDGTKECTGLLLVCDGQLRAFILSDEGREITLYRLLERDICLFSASCIITSIQFDITVTAEKDTSFWLIPTEIYKNLMSESVIISNYTNEIMAMRMSDVMWLMEQVMWKSFDKRLAGFLLEESALNDSEKLSITHETIANHLGTAREVVTRMLKYFQSEGLVTLSRGSIEIINKNMLNQLSDS